MHQVDIPSIPKKRLTQLEAETIFEQSRRAWEASEPCRQLRETLATAIAPRKIAKVVGLACGPIVEKSSKGTWAARFSTQHALLLTLQDVFKGLGGDAQVPCYVQDPAYSYIDKTILAAAGLIVLSDPMGLVEIDDESAVFSINPNIPVKEIVRDFANPALIIWQAGPEEALTSTV